MERPKYFFSLISVCIILSPCILKSQEDYKTQIYHAYINGDMKKWEWVIREMESQPISSINKIELAGYYYGYVAYLIGNNEKKTAKKYMEKAEKLLNDVLAYSPDNSTANAMKGAFIGFKLALNKFKAPALGPKSMKLINKAYDTDPNNPQAIADKANMLYYAPGVFGGDKKEALELYKKAIQRFENTGNTSNNWFYLNLLVTLGQLYEQQKQYNQAQEIYLKALQIEPDFKWVKNELLPQLQ